MLRGLVVALVFALLLGATMGEALAQDDAEATIEALQTQVAELTTPSPTPRQRTPTPSTSRPTLAGAGESRLPPAVAKIAEQDSETACDEIGWGLSADDINTDRSIDRPEHHLACLGGAGYFVICMDVTESARGGLISPDAGSLWLACAVRVTNLGSEDVQVNPLDFDLVTAGGQRISTSFEPMVAFPDQEMLPPGAVPSDQYVEGWIYFVVDASDEQPFRIEIDPLTFSLGGQEQGVVIIEELVDPDDLD